MTIRYPLRIYICGKLAVKQPALTTAKDGSVDPKLDAAETARVDTLNAKTAAFLAFEMIALAQAGQVEAIAFQAGSGLDALVTLPAKVKAVSPVPTATAVNGYGATLVYMLDDAPYVMGFIDGLDRNTVLIRDARNH